MQGSCECGSIEYTCEGALGDVVVCHCSQCRKTSGHIWASTTLPEEQLHIAPTDDLVWYDSSEEAKRGYCKKCGSSLFYKRHDEDFVAVAAGTLDGPTGLKVKDEIFLDDKGDYYACVDRRAETGEFKAPVKASCECGGVSLEITKPPLSTAACHCEQCRKSSGHFWAGAHLPKDGFTLTSSDTLDWFESTDVAKKGFCNACGSTIFWWLDGRDGPSVSAGILETPSGLTMARHQFVTEKGDYYTIDDDLPQAPGFDLVVTGGE